MSFTLNLEIIHKDRPDLGWYSPEIEGFALYPRTKEAASIAAVKLVRLAKKNKHFIEQYQIVIYTGRVRFYHKDRKKENLIAVLTEADLNP